MSLPHWPPSLPLTDAIDAAPAPPALVCPITRRLMRSPALVATTGRSYEREDLVRWVRANGTDPVDVTVRVSTDELVPNLALRSSIETHAIEANGGRVTKVHYNRLGLRALLKPHKFPKGPPKPARTPVYLKKKVDREGALPAPEREAFS